MGKKHRDPVVTNTLVNTDNENEEEKATLPYTTEDKYINKSGTLLDVCCESEHLLYSTHICTGFAADLTVQKDEVTELLRFLTKPRHTSLLVSRSSGPHTKINVEKDITPCDPDSSKTSKSSFYNGLDIHSLAEIVRHAVLRFELRNCSLPSKHSMTLRRNAAILKNTNSKKDTAVRHDPHVNPSRRTQVYDPSSDVYNAETLGFICDDVERGLAALRYILYPIAFGRYEKKELSEFRQFVIVTNHYTLFISRYFASIPRLSPFLRYRLSVYLSSTSCASTHCQSRKPKSDDVTENINNDVENRFKNMESKCFKTQSHCLHSCSSSSTLLPEAHAEVSGETRKYLNERCVCFHTEEDVRNLAWFLRQECVEFSYGDYRTNSSWAKNWKQLVSNETVTSTKSKPTNGKISPKNKNNTDTLPVEPARSKIKVLYILSNTFFLYSNECSWASSKVMSVSEPGTNANESTKITQLSFNSPLLPMCVFLLREVLQKLTTAELISAVTVNLKYDDPPPNIETTVLVFNHTGSSSKNKKRPNGGNHAATSGYTSKDYINVSLGLYHGVTALQPLQVSVEDATFRRPLKYAGKWQPVTQFSIGVPTKLWSQANTSGTLVLQNENDYVLNNLGELGFLFETNTTQIYGEDKDKLENSEKENRSSLCMLQRRIEKVLSRQRSAGTNRLVEQAARLKKKQRITTSDSAKTAEEEDDYDADTKTFTRNDLLPLCDLGDGDQQIVLVEQIFQCIK